MPPKLEPSRLIIFVVVFVDLLGFGIMIPMLPFFARNFGASAFEVGLLMFVYSLMQILVSPIWGQISDKWGRRPVLLITILGQALAFLWAGMSTTFISLLMSRLLSGIFAANISTANAYMADVTPPEERAKGMGLIGAAFGLGFIFGPAIGGLLIPHGVEWPSLVAAGICILNFILAFFILPEPRIHPSLREGNRRKLSFIAIKDALKNPAFFHPMLSFFLITFAFVQLEITFGLFVLDRFKFHERDAGFLLAFLGVTMAVVQGMMMGPLTKKFSEIKLIRGGGIFAILGLIGAALSFNIISLMAALVFIAIGYSLMNPCLSALTSRAASAGQQGSVLGVFQSFGSFARVLAPLTAGYFYDLKMELPLFSAVACISLMWLLWSSRRA